MRGESVEGKMTGKNESDIPVPALQESAEIQAARKEPSAFRPLYERYYRRVLGFVYNRVECKDLAFDLTSQVFLEAMGSLHRYTDRGLPFHSWLFRIALHLLGKHFRSGKVKRTVTLSESGLREIQAEQESPAQDAELYAALQSLPESDMQLIEMRFFEQRAFAEMASILEITESAAKQRTYRILSVLKERMKRINQ